MRKMIYRWMAHLCVLVVVGVVSACGVDRWPYYAEQTETDTWMYNVMSEQYLWFESLPSYKSVNPFLNPADFLNKIKYQTDSFSFVDTLESVPLPTYGFDYVLSRSLDNDTAYYALITHVVPNSPASEVGLERGQWVMKVNGEYMSAKRADGLLTGKDAVKLTIGMYRQISPAGENEGGETGTPIYRVVEAGEYALGAARSLTESPLHHASIITLSTSEKVGYLVYNSFTSGTIAEPNKYDEALRSQMNEFAAAGVKTLILDLRRNHRGESKSVQLLATLLAPASYLGQPMGSLVYNKKQAASQEALSFDANLIGGGTNLNLQKLVVLTSSETAGPSEVLMMFLNGKVPHVMAVGQATKGQNVLTKQFVNPQGTWSLNPVVCMAFNSEGATYTTGFSPTVSVANADTDYLNYLPYGNPQESLLSAAIKLLETGQ